MDTKELEKKVESYLQRAVEKQQLFLGRTKRSRPFNIYGLCKDVIIVKYTDEGSYPMHYVLEKKTLVEGIIQAISKNWTIRLTGEYASEVEFSRIRREGTKNSTSALTKFYFSLHNSFLNQMKQEKNGKF